MASIVETKAVAIRKGNHAENMAFTGVQAEVVADLGEPDPQTHELGTDSQATLRLHNGVTRGGIPMARADMLNVSTDLLAKNRNQVNDKNLAYANLSNIEYVDNLDTTSKTKIKQVLTSYGIADKEEVDQELENKVNLNTNNLNTVNLTSDIIHNGVDGNYPLAYANTSNINTADLVDTTYHSGTSGNKPLAYADFSNVDTTNITLPQSGRTGLQVTGPVVSTSTFDNTDTTNLTLEQYDPNDNTTRPSGMSGPVLARSDLANVSDSTLENIFSNSSFALERTTNKDSLIDESNVVASHYPQTAAVVTYVNDKINESTSQFADLSLTNIIDWGMLYGTSSYPVLKRNNTIISSQNKFKLGEEYDTGIYLINDEQDTLSATVTSVDSSGTIESNGLTIEKNVGTVDLTNKNPFVIVSETNTTATFTITSTDNLDGTYTYAVDTLTSGGSGFHVEDATHSGNYIIKSNGTNEYFSVCNQLKIIALQINVDDQVNNTGTIVKAQCEPNYGFTPISEPSMTISSGNGTTATFSISTTTYNENGPAKVAKTDLTNLNGMNQTDKVNELDAPWRIRHNETFPSTSSSNIPATQDYTIATNGAVWRELKQEYYTKAEVDALIQQIYNTINGYHPS